MLRGVTLLALLAVATPAAAVVKVATYQGTLASGYDQTGLFGTPGASLAGLRYTSVYVYRLGPNDRITIPPTFDSMSGWYGCNPVQTASITINGFTQTIQHDSFFNLFDGDCGTVNIDGAYHFENSGEVTADSEYTTDHSRFINLSNSDPDVRWWISDSGYFDGMPGSLDTNVTPTSLTSHSGDFSFKLQDYNSNGYTVNSYGRSTGTAIYSVRDAIPEPAIWALMIAGFGMVGFAMRRRTFSTA